MLSGSVLKNGNFYQRASLLIIFKISKFLEVPGDSSNLESLDYDSTDGAVERHGGVIGNAETEISCSGGVVLHHIPKFGTQIITKSYLVVM